MNHDPFSLRRRAIIRINGRLLGAAVCASLAWFLWPSSAEWWGFGALSLLLAVTVPATLIGAGRIYLAFRARERAIAAYAAQGAPVKSASMASRRALIDAGMIDE